MSDTRDLEKLIAGLPMVEAPAGWKDRVHASIQAGVQPKSRLAPAKPRSGRIIGIAVLAAAAALAIYFSIDRTPAPSATIAVRVETVAGATVVRDRGAAEIGETIVFEADGEALRAYRDGALVAYCPGHSRCTRSRSGFLLALEVTARGDHFAISYTPALPVPEPSWSPSARDADLDISSAARTGAQMKPSAHVDVR